MEQLMSNLNSTSDYQPNVILDLNTSKEYDVDVRKASIQELSSIIVSDMMESVKSDLSSLNIQKVKANSK